MKRVLLIQPLFPVTYWGFQDAIRLVNKRATLPPLGLIALAAALPEDWDLRLVDLNVTPLEDRDLQWADVVFLSGMLVQLDSMQGVIARAQGAGCPVVVGGPTATTTPADFDGVAVIFQGEAEGRIGELVRAVEGLLCGAAIAGEAPRVLAPQGARPDMSSVPVPRFDLLDLSQYASMSIQYSRGCPFNCEFCDVVQLFGNAPRVKTRGQILRELDELHRLGFVGSVFFVDDNFIGNKRAVRQLLPDIAAWQRDHGRPFDFYTEASVNLAADEGLMADMVEAGFRAVFVGIETPSKESLAEAGKKQNLAVDASEAVDIMTRAGLEVMGGFIVGFDSDGPEIFEAQRQMIQSAPIPLAMVGVLFALHGTPLWHRLRREGRLRELTRGDQFGRANFQPSMDEEQLLRGYRDLLHELYSAEAYYARCAAYVRRSGPLPRCGREGLTDIKHFLKAVVRVGALSGRRRHFWRLLRQAVGAAPHTLKWSVVHALQGEHMIRYTEEHVVPRLDRAIAEVVAERRSEVHRARPEGRVAGAASPVPTEAVVAHRPALEMG